MNIENEIARTCAGLETELTDDGRYVRIGMGDCGWWQPVDKLAPLLRGMMSWDDRLAIIEAAYARASLARGWECDEPEDLDSLDKAADAEAAADWCRETGPAGYFGHNSAPDTMPVPADFTGELPS